MEGMCVGGEFELTAGSCTGDVRAKGPQCWALQRHEHARELLHRERGSQTTTEGRRGRPGLAGMITGPHKAP